MFVFPFSPPVEAATCFLQHTNMKVICHISLTFYCHHGSSEVTTAQGIFPDVLLCQLKSEFSGTMYGCENKT